MQTRETRIVRQIRRGFGTWCTNSYMSDKTPSRCPLDAFLLGVADSQRLNKRRLRHFYLAELTHTLLALFLFI